MSKLPFIIIAFLLSACSDSYEEHLDKNKTRLPYTNIELRLPKILNKVAWGADLYETKGGELSLSVSASPQGYLRDKDLMTTVLKSVNNVDTVYSSFVPSSVAPVIDDYEYHSKPENSDESITYEKKFGVDGGIGIRFNINHNDNEAIRDKLAGIAKASLNTLSHSRTPVDLTEGLKHKVGQLDNMRLAYRSNQDAVYYKKNMTISVEYTLASLLADNTYFILDTANVYENEDSHCKEMMTESTENISISNKKSEAKIVTQKCKKQSYRAIRTEIPTENDGFFTITMILPAELDLQPFHAFYTEFLTKISIP